MLCYQRDFKLVWVRSRLKHYHWLHLQTFQCSSDLAEDTEDDEILRKQQELEEMIRRQQAELTRIQQEREAEDERVSIRVSLFLVVACSGSKRCLFIFMRMYQYTQ